MLKGRWQRLGLLKRFPSTKRCFQALAVLGPMTSSFLLEAGLVALESPPLLRPIHATPEHVVIRRMQWVLSAREAARLKRFSSPLPRL